MGGERGCRGGRGGGDPRARGTYGQGLFLATDLRTPADIAAMFGAATGRPHRILAPSRDAQVAALVASGREPVYATARADYVEAINAGAVPDAGETFDTVEQVAGRPGMTWEGFIAKHAA